MDRLINNSFLSLEPFYQHSRLINDLTINGYQLFTVVWNLFLTAIPLFVFLYLKKLWRAGRLRNSGQKVFGLILFFVWLIFLPNAAYIMTDARHLLNYCPAGSLDNVCPENAWMIMFFFAYSACGWVSFYYLLKLMVGLFEEIFNRLAAGCLLFFSIPLVSLGVLLGLLNRFNSWDIFFYPSNLLQAVSVYFSRPAYFIDWLFFTVFLYLLYFTGDAIFRKVKSF